MALQVAEELQSIVIAVKTKKYKNQFFATIMRDKMVELDTECRKWHQKMKEYSFLDIQEIPSRPSSVSEHDIFSIKSNDDTTAEIMSDDELSDHLKTIDTMLSRTEKRPELPAILEPPTPPVESTEDSTKSNSTWTVSQITVATLTLGSVVLLSRWVIKQWMQ
jgi:hypothetical protein